MLWCSGLNPPPAVPASHMNMDLRLAAPVPVQLTSNVPEKADEDETQHLGPSPQVGDLREAPGF